MSPAFRDFQSRNQPAAGGASLLDLRSLRITAIPLLPSYPTSPLNPHRFASTNLTCASVPTSA